MENETQTIASEVDARLHDHEHTETVASINEFVKKVFVSIYQGAEDNENMLSNVSYADAL